MKKQSFSNLQCDQIWQHRSIKVDISTVEKIQEVIRGIQSREIQGLKRQEEKRH